jgi:hypothetical protein
VNGLTRRLLLLLPAAGVVAGCELIAGISDIAYSPDAGSSGASSGDQAATGSTASGDDGQSGTTGSAQSGTGQQSGTAEPDQDGVAPMPEASSGASQSGSSAGSGSSSGSEARKDSGPDVTADASPHDSSTSDVTGLCVPASGSGALPFAVDSVYSPTGSFGTGSTTTTNACTVARSSATAKGSCHTASYTVTAGGAFAGVFWQDNFNWGTQGGYAIPAGATKITFSAMGKVGGEKVTFVAGYSGSPTPTTPCTDTIRGSLGPVTLTTAWTPYTMTITGGYPNGVLGAFGWEANAPDAAGSMIDFYIDDIEYQ